MITLQGISKTYMMGPTEVGALKDVDLHIDEGEFVAIIGPSGSGKSTLLHVLGFLDRPDKGSYRFLDKDVTEYSDDRLAAIRNRVAGFVFQQFHLLPRISAVENAMLPLVYSGRSGDYGPAERRIAEVGLDNRADHNPNELSGGEQQRVAIARSLVNDPVLILADEPTGNLDSRSEDEIVNILKDLNRAGKTIIMVTHEEEIARNAGRIITMRDGVIVSDEKTENAPPQVEAESAQKRSLEDISMKGGRAGLGDYLDQAFHAIASHKMRAFLSILGILIGVASVIAMVSITQGASELMEEQVKSLGSNLLSVRAGGHSHGGVKGQSGVVTRFTDEDRDALLRLPLIKDVYGSVWGRAQVVYGPTNCNTMVEGVDVSYEKMRLASPQAGRFFTRQEVESRSKVVLLGTTVVEDLFGDENPVGRTIKVDRVNFKVIGVLPPKGTSSWRDWNDTIVMPLSTAMYRLLGNKYIHSFMVEVVSTDKIEQAQEAIIDLIAKRHRWPEGYRDGLHMHNMTEIKEMFTSVTRTMGWLLGSIAAISLFVGGIGIMNIMLVSVTERTREIGLSKAVGARKIDIMTQFLIESIALTFAGGVLGVGLGLGIAYLLSKFASLPYAASEIGITLAVTVSVVIGLVFGLWPARQAAKLDPISALRYE